MNTERSEPEGAVFPNRSRAGVVERRVLEEDMMKRKWRLDCPKDGTYTMRMPKDLRKQLERIATKEYRTLANLLLHIAYDYVRFYKHIKRGQR